MAVAGAAAGVAQDLVDEGVGQAVEGAAEIGAAATIEGVAEALEEED
jgi:hypothetical protein